MILNFFIYAFVGGIAQFFLRKFPLTGKILNKIIPCNLCLGVWIYTFFAFVMKQNILDNMLNLPIIGYIMTGAITSFIVWLFVIGWKSEFTVTMVE